MHILRFKMLILNFKTITPKHYSLKYYIFSFYFLMAGFVKCVGSVIDHTYEVSHRRFDDSPLTQFLKESIRIWLIVFALCCKIDFEM